MNEVVVEQRPLNFRAAHVGTAAPGCPAGQSPAARCALLSAAVLLTMLVSSPCLFASDCIPIREASKHVGETKCVIGKVLRVKVASKGVHFLDFCEDQMACPFTVVVFPADLKDVGDVRRLKGHTIEVSGAVKLYDSRAEIVLKRISQVAGGSSLIPPLPKEYDVEKTGHYSAGHLRPTKKPAKVKGVPNTTATYGNAATTDPPP